MKERIDEIRQRLEEEEIKYLVFREVETFAKHWTAYPFEDETYNNEHCGSAGCHYLRNGEISKCPDAILVDFMAEGHTELSGLRLHDRVKLAEETDGWKLIERIDRPIDMCKKCTYQRLERKKWERVDEEPQPSDWLLPHRYEAEIAKLKCANEKAKREINDLNRKSEVLNQKIENQNNKITELNEKNRGQNEEISSLKRDNRNKGNEINAGKEKIREFEIKEKELKTEINEWKEKWKEADNSFGAAQQAYERVNNSYSNKIGRVVTWLPRSVRRLVKCYLIHKEKK